MPKQIPADELDQIEKAMRAHPGITSAEIADVLAEQVPRRTLQFRLKRLVDHGRVLRGGKGAGRVTVRSALRLPRHSQKLQ